MQKSKAFSSMRETFGRKISELGDEYKNLLVVTADVGESTKAIYFKEKFPNRYFNVGISEQHLIDFAAGLATTGKLPVVTGFAMFLMRAWEQIRNTICRMNLNVKIVATHSGYSDNNDGSSHQSLEDIALMRVLPRMKIIVPADSLEVKRSLPVILNEPGPIYYRIGRDYSPPITQGILNHFKVGEATILKDGSDITIIGAGIVLWDAIKSAKRLEQMNISAAVINMSTIKPIDEKAIESYARKTGRVITVEEHNVLGGLGSAVSEVIVKKYPVPMKMIGANDFGRSARSQRELLDYYKINDKSIINASLELLRLRY
ncbi:MAG: transketolase family protein [Thermoproteota archaeon]|nr:transketolase family protein [Candidatus Brockarchaeota archaeon]MBO3767854.1 transketolase family protein [Candidatus Brockarchaeota archaeon]MBO3801624.1 transketolase family protein [Candidatus Brockarchaeota archaeon]